MVHNAPADFWWWRGETSRSRKCEIRVDGVLAMCLLCASVYVRGRRGRKRGRERSGGSERRREGRESRREGQIV